MSTLELKTTLHGLIETTEDFDILEAVYMVLSKQKSKIAKLSANKDFWDDLPEALKQEIEEGIEEADRGELIDHEVVMKNTLTPVIETFIFVPSS